MNRRNILILTAILFAAGYFLFSGGGGVANSPPGDGPWVALGDSLTAGVGAGGEANAWPAVLGARLGVEIINRGVSGETAAQAARRLQGEVLALDPSVVFVLLGGNDLLSGKPADDTFRVLDDIVGQCTDAGAMVVLIGIEGPPVLAPDYSGRFEELTGRHGCLYVPDIMDGMLLRRELMSDSIHPNAAGYRIFADRIGEALAPHLD